MHEKEIVAIAERVKAVAEEMVYPDPLPAGGQKIIGGTQPTMSFALPDAGDEMLARLIADRLYPKWSDKFSEKHIAGRLNALLLEAAESRDTSAVEAGVRRLVADYEAFGTEYLVLQP